MPQNPRLHPILEAMKRRYEETAGKDMCPKLRNGKHRFTGYPRERATCRHCGRPR